jgi:hypothetical protein
VRRREPDEGAPGGVPSRLRRFVPEQWPGADIWERHGAWLDAREAWEDEHGDWPEDLSEAMASFRVPGPWPWPDEPFDPDLI